MAYYEYNEDDADDDLQKLLEGRDGEDDESEYQFHKRQVEENFDKRKRDVSPEDAAADRSSTKKKLAGDKVGLPKAKRPEQAMFDDFDRLDAIDADDEMADFIINDMDEDMEDDDAAPRDDEAIEVPDTAGTVIKVKRIVQNPRPKLDFFKIKSAKGLVSLKQAQKELHLKGKGYEKDDLNQIMFKLETWSHRLFPKLNFEDFLEKMEQLGTKKVVAVYVKKIRIGMELDDAGEFVEDEVQVNEEEIADKDYMEDDPDMQLTAEEAFDKLFDNNSVTETVDKTSKRTESTLVLSDEQAELIEKKRKDAIARRLNLLEQQLEQKQQPIEDSD